MEPTIKGSATDCPPVSLACCITLGVTVVISGSLAFWIYRRYRCTRTSPQLVETMERDLNRAEEQIRVERQAKESALTRLSQIASERLRDNNPAIADLSDVNRPTKLGEQMSELYDNEWTEAFQCLERSFGESDRKYIDLLLKVLMDVYDVCQGKASEQLDIFANPFGVTCSDTTRNGQASPTNLSSVPLAIKDARKKMSANKMKLINEGVVQRLMQTKVYYTDYKLIVADSCRAYINKCIELCWMMSVQDPPVVLERNPGLNFNTNQFRAYTASGPRMAYVVWPMVKLHDNGPLLCKGVAQGAPKVDQLVRVV